MSGAGPGGRSPRRIPARPVFTRSAALVASAGHPVGECCLLCRGGRHAGGAFQERVGRTRRHHGQHIEQSEESGTGTPPGAQARGYRSALPVVSELCPAAQRRLRLLFGRGSPRRHGPFRAVDFGPGQTGRPGQQDSKADMKSPMPCELRPDQVVAIIDTREQLPLDLSPLRTEPGTLATGDYSVKGLVDVVAIGARALPTYSVASVRTASGLTVRYIGCWPIPLGRSSWRPRGATWRPAAGEARSRPPRQWEAALVGLPRGCPSSWRETTTRRPLRFPVAFHRGPAAVERSPRPCGPGHASRAGRAGDRLGRD